MAAGTLSDYVGTLIKTLFSSAAIEDSTLKKSPALGLLKKDESFDGVPFREIQFYGDLKGVGHTFTGAQNMVGNPNDAVFDLTRAETYAVAQLDHWAIEASKSNKAAFIPILKRHMDSALHSIGQTCSMNIFRDTWCDRGVISAVSTVYVDVPRENHILFEKGMPLVGAITATGLLRSNTVLTISNINRSYSSTLCRLTMSASAAALSWAATDTLYRSTDTNKTDASAGTGLGITGFRGWMPATVGTLFGQDCTLDTDRLGGGRFDASSYSMREGMLNAISEASLGSAEEVDTCFMHPLKYQRLVNELGTNVRYCQEMAARSNGSPAKVGFTGVELIGGANPVKVYPDKFCQFAYAYLLTRRTWTIRSLNQVPHVLNLDGQDLMKKDASNNYEIRWGASWQLGCSNVGANMVVTLPT